MKKYLKILLTATLIISMAITLTGCEKEEEKTNEPNNNTSIGTEKTPETENKVDATPTSKLKSSAIFDIFKGEKYVIKYKAILPNDAGQNVEATVTSAMDGENIFADIPELGYATLIKGDTVYSIMHETKQYITMTGVLAENDVAAISAEEIGENPEDTLVTSGNQTFKGVDYYCEEFKLTNETVKLYFSGDDLKYLVTTADGEEIAMEILEISKDVNSSYFELPSGYSAMTF